MSTTEPTTTRITAHELVSELVPSPVAYRVLRPPTGADGDDLALLVFLHGGGGSADLLDTLVPVFDEVWAEQSLPPVVVATPSAGRSFYLDRFDGAQQWERFLADELVPHLVESTGAGRGGTAVCVGGISMGGMGSLRLAFRQPERFVAVAALEPAIEEAVVWDQVLRRDRVYRDDGLMHELFGDPVDADHFRDNHPRAIAERNGHRIAAAGLSIYLECGDEDLLQLQYGTEALHRQLFAHGIDHEYRLVRGANHVGPSVPGRVADALRFLGRTLTARDEPEPAPDPMITLVSEMIAAQEVERGYRRTELVDGPSGPLEVHLIGEGPAVVLVPSLGRAAADFDQLARRVARAGYQAVMAEPRGIGASVGPLDGVSMADLADDVAAVIEAVAIGPATVVGHAFGNRVARMTATRHPELVESVVLLACGGLVPPAPEIGAALRSVFDDELAPEAHLDAVATAFFAPGNDASVWRDGWYGEVAAVQARATRETSASEWWTAGRADVLVVQPADDLIAVPENGTRILDELGARATMITIPAAGHALLPEQPAAVAVALLTWLDRRGLEPR